MLTSMDKSIAAGIGALIPVLVSLGFDLPPALEDPAVVAAVSTLLAMVLTYWVKNKET